MTFCEGGVRVSSTAVRQALANDDLDTAETLLGHPAKAKEKLGWEPKTSFEDMVAEMAREDLALSMRDAVCKVAGFKTFSHNE